MNEAISEKTVNKAKLCFQSSTLHSIMEVQRRLLEIMNDMKNQDDDDEEEFEFQEFEAVLDLYKTLTNVVEL